MEKPPQEIPPPAKKHFAYQLAQYALYAPFVALAIGCVGSGAINPAHADSVSNPGGTIGAALLLAGFNLLLLLTSVIAGIAALCFVPRLGGKGIVGRSITGLLLSSLFLSASAYIFFMPSIPARVQARIAGDWYTTVRATGVGSAHVKMSLNANGTARWEMLDGPRPMALTGHWRVASLSKTSPDLSLQIQLDAPLPNAPDVNGLGWRIQQVGDDQLDLTTNDAGGKPTNEIYMRKP
jgi:hypothetical protein